ncbi:MAG TPA: MFS transporter [Stellaceae bacterium]|nr:MFS transporter [Stellaceae bacterium]
MRLTTGTLITITSVGQVAGMAGFVSFPALQPEFQRLWALSDSEAGFISGIYFAGYVLAVPLASGLTDRVEARRVYLASLLFGVAGALGFALATQGLASAALWRFLQGAAFGGAHMPGLRALSEVVPGRRQGTAIAVYTGSFTVGSSLSFALSGLLAGAFGWRSGFALLALGPLAAAAIAYAVLPPTPLRREPRHAKTALKSLLQNRRALRFVVAYGLHNSEVSIMRAWMVALLAASAAETGMAYVGGYATIVATAANLLGLPLIVLTNEIATRRERNAVIAIVMTTSGLLGVTLALAAPFSPVITIGAAILFGGIATADSGTINTGLFAAADPGRRGAFLALHAMSGFGASAISPILFGLLLDLTGGSGRASAWIIAFATQAAINALWPLSYVLKRR